MNDAKKYTLTYEGHNNHRVNIEFSPHNDTWDSVLPYFMDFLRAIGYVFDRNEILTITEFNTENSVYCNTDVDFNTKNDEQV